MSENTIVIRSAAADGSRPIALNGEVIGSAVLDGDWHVTYIRPDNGVETWFTANSLPAIKASLHSIYGLAPPAKRRRDRSTSTWLRNGRRI